MAGRPGSLGGDAGLGAVQVFPRPRSRGWNFYPRSRRDDSACRCSSTFRGDGMRVGLGEASHPKGGDWPVDGTAALSRRG